MFAMMFFHGWGDGVTLSSANSTTLRHMAALKHLSNAAWEASRNSGSTYFRDKVAYEARVRAAGGVVIDGVECYGKIGQYSNISVVCEDEYNDYIYCDGFPDWSLAVKKLKNLHPDVVQLSAV